MSEEEKKGIHKRKGRQQQHFRMKFSHCVIIILLQPSKETYFISKEA